MKASITAAIAGLATLASAQSSPISTFDPNTAKDCTFWRVARPTDTCEQVAEDNYVTVKQILAWNPSLSATTCSFIVGNSYCVERDDSNDPELTISSAPATTTTAGNGLATPTPIQEGVVANCNKWHVVGATTTCAGIITYNKLAAADFYKWNPALGTDCAGIQKGYYTCVGVVGPIVDSSTVSAPAATTTTIDNGIPTPTPVMPMIDANCNKFHLVRSTTTCQGIIDYNHIASADFYKWNPSVGRDCLNLWVDYYMCVGVVGSTTVSAGGPTTTAIGNGISTPTPIMAGIPSNCNKFHLVGSTTTCAGIIAYNTIAAADFYKWNPAVGTDCSKLWAAYYVCVGVVSSTTVKTSLTTTTTTTKAGNGIATPAPVMAGIPSNCNKFHFVGATTTCAGIIAYNHIAAADFYKWNPGVGSGCAGLWASYYVCVGVVGSTTIAPVATTTKAGNGIATPTPVQPNMVKNCRKFHVVSSGTTCQGIASYNKIKLADFYKWNPDVGTTCSKLFIGYYTCVAVL